MNDNIFKTCHKIWRWKNSGKLYDPSNSMCYTCVCMSVYDLLESVRPPRNTFSSWHPQILHSEYTSGWCINLYTPSLSKKFVIINIGSLKHFHHKYEWINGRINERMTIQCNMLALEISVLLKKFGGSVQRNVINNSNGPLKKLGLLNVFIFFPQLTKKKIPCKGTEISKKMFKG